ncbi:hypothetical protein X735_11925 [Mesorhizobium sp. L2C085B000]|nr:hypothetical protein X735_11925 [Mesorhizobium sp. L2C085B000]
MDHTRQAIQESRELLKRLRQRYREDMAQVLEDEDDLAPMRISGSMPTFSAPHFKT